MIRTAALLTIALLLLGVATVSAGAHSGTITLSMTPEVPSDATTLKLWVPYPLSDPYQTISDVHINGNNTGSGVYRDPVSEAVYLYAEWNPIQATPRLTLRFHLDLKSRKINIYQNGGQALPETVEKYRQSTDWVPSDAYRDQAAEITKGKTDILSKAKAIYDWTVAHTFRDPTVKACGLGLPQRTLKQCAGGGKCADISAVFVTLARAAGLAARDVYGLRVADPQDGDITGSYHCWAEFYLPGTGWVPADPADVRKMMLVHNVELKDAGAWKQFFWGGDDLFRVVLEKDARGVTFNPPQQSGPAGYFMYPYAEADGTALDYFDAQNFHYEVSYKGD